jgi:hypothetical protein
LTSLPVHSSAGAASDSDHKDTAALIIAKYHADHPAASVRELRRLMPHPEKNPRFKDFQAQIIRAWEASEFAPYRLDDPQLEERLREVIEPVLRLYGRETSFKLVVIRHHVPVAMNDSGAVLMISTCLLERAVNDDEVLALVAHEVAHDLFWQRTAKARETLARNADKGQTPEVQEALNELARIEFECDAVAAVTLAAMGRNPTYFGLYLQALERDFSEYLNLNLPPCALRAQVISDVVPAEARRIPAQVSEPFRRLKAMLPIVRP